MLARILGNARMKRQQWFFQALGRLADTYQVLGIQGVLTMVGSFSLGAWAAAASEWLNAWGPIGWVFSGLAVAGFAVLILNAWAHYGMRSAQSRAWGAMAERTFRVNPLDEQFARQRINIADFFNPFSAVYRNKTFIDCEFMGPGVVAFVNSNVEIDGIIDCEFIEVAGNIHVRNVVGFENAALRRCRFYRMTLLFPPNDAQRLRQTNPALVWLTPNNQVPPAPVAPAPEGL